MTPAQIDLLKRLINLDRAYWKKRAKGNELAHREERGIEVGWSANARTAQSLVQAGLAEILSINNVPGQTWIFLGSYEPDQEI